MAPNSPDGTTFSRLGPPGAPTPLVIAVPHAGRHYPDALLALARLPRHALETIEDRYADLLIPDAVAAGAVAVVARTARALLDLNRDPREIDPAMMARDRPPDGAWLATDKVSGGLGVVPSRIAAGGAVWRHPLDVADIAARIEAVHRPYHAAIAAALARAQGQHGVAVLLDCHSMPSLGAGGAARIVIGDRHGASAAAGYTAAVEAAVRRFGLTLARNRPYAGGFTLDRHGEPRLGRHAIQVEIDRSLYLDSAHREPGPGLPRARALIAAIAAALIDAAGVTTLAAE